MLCKNCYMNYTWASKHDRNFHWSFAKNLLVAKIAEILSQSLLDLYLRQSLREFFVRWMNLEESHTPTNVCKWNMLQFLENTSTCFSIYQYFPHPYICSALITVLWSSDWPVYSKKELIIIYNTIHRTHILCSGPMFCKQISCLVNMSISKDSCQSTSVQTLMFQHPPISNILQQSRVSVFTQHSGIQPLRKYNLTKQYFLVRTLIRKDF